MTDPHRTPPRSNRREFLQQTGLAGLGLAALAAPAAAADAEPKRRRRRQAGRGEGDDEARHQAAAKPIVKVPKTTSRW
jgi:hypothetical protein